MTRQGRLATIGHVDSRWSHPYQSSHSPGETEWTVMLKHPLTAAEKAYGLRERLVASTLAELKHKQDLQDAVYKDFEKTPVVPEWMHRA